MSFYKPPQDSFILERPTREQIEELFGTKVRIPSVDKHGKLSMENVVLIAIDDNGILIGEVEGVEQRIYSWQEANVIEVLYRDA